MKKILLACVMVVLLASCSKNTPWEYKVVKVAGMPAEESPGTPAELDQSPN